MRAEIKWSPLFKRWQVTSKGAMTVGRGLVLRNVTFPEGIVNRRDFVAQGDFFGESVRALFNNLTRRQREARERSKWAEFVEITGLPEVENNIWALIGNETRFRPSRGGRLIPELISIPRSAGLVAFQDRTVELRNAEFETIPNPHYVPQPRLRRSSDPWAGAWGSVTART